MEAVAAQPQSANAFDWYKPGKSIAEFHSSKARTRALIGARGSGKTTGWAVDALGHAFHNPGAKIYVLRKTQKDNTVTTQDTFEEVLRACGSAYLDTGYSLFKKIDGGTHYRLPSREAVEMFNIFMRSGPNKGEILRWLETVGNRWCSFVHFAGVPDESKRAGRFRGYECSMLVFVEADQLLQEDWEMALFCLRWKNARGEHIEDTCCILDTNPPSPRHWIAKLEERSQGDPEVRFWHIPMEENRHNLPPGYVEDAKRMYAANPAMYKRMILGEYAEAFDGSRVLWAFSEEHAAENLPWPRGYELLNQSVNSLAARAATRSRSIGLIGVDAQGEWLARLDNKDDQPDEAQPAHLTTPNAQLTGGGPPSAPGIGGGTAEPPSGGAAGSCSGGMNR
jgi:hypothetical protein